MSYHDVVAFFTVVLAFLLGVYFSMSRWNDDQ